MEPSPVRRGRAAWRCRSTCSPGESTTVEIVYAWHFPNRYADFDRFGDSDNPDAAPAWIGNHYATTFADAADVVRHYAERRSELRHGIIGLARGAAQQHAADRSHRDARCPAVAGPQPDYVPHCGRQVLRLRGRARRIDAELERQHRRFVPAELHARLELRTGCLRGWFPELERSMRETDWDVLQAPEGYLPHRVQLPADGPQLHGRPIGGPTRPALDGMLGTILKTYREVRQGAGSRLACSATSRTLGG